MNGAGIIIYYTENDITYILIGTEGRYLSDNDPSITSIETLSHHDINITPETHFASLAKQLSVDKKTCVHFDQITETSRENVSQNVSQNVPQKLLSVHFVCVTKESKQGMVKGTTDIDDQLDLIKTISREMKEEIGISLEELNKTYEDLIYLGMTFGYTIYGLCVTNEEKQKIENSIQKLHENYQGELFYTKFIDMKDIQKKMLNRKTKDALMMIRKFFYNNEQLD